MKEALKIYEIYPSKNLWREKKWWHLKKRYGYFAADEMKGDILSKHKNQKQRIPFVIIEFIWTAHKKAEIYKFSDRLKKYKFLDDVFIE